MTIESEKNAPTARATLADAQPGGRVRLGDASWPEIDAILADAYSAGATGLPFEGIARRHAVRAAVAALSAQPSPGGQGEEGERGGWRKMQKASASQTRKDGVGACDALYELAVKHGARDTEAAGFAHHVNGSLALLESQVHDGLHREATMESALAARQPVEVSEGGFRAAASRQTASAESNATAEALIAAARQTAGENPAWRDELVREAYNRGLADGLNADRQPVGEVIEYQSYHGYGGGQWSTCDKKLYDNGKAFEAKYGAGQMSLYRALVVGDAAPPAQAVDLGAVRALLQRRIEQWRSHLPADPGAPGTREIETKGEHDYNNDVRIYREGIAVMEEAVALIGQTVQAVDLGDFKALYRAYVRLLESARDRIIDLGGTCDPVDVMEANDVDLQAARRVLDSHAVGNGR